MSVLFIIETLHLVKIVYHFKMILLIILCRLITKLIFELFIIASGGGKAIRTLEGYNPTDLQSASFSHLDIPPATVRYAKIFF